MNRYTSVSIRVKIVAIAAAVLLVCVAVLTTYNYLTLSHTVEQAAGERLLSFSQAAVRQSGETVLGSAKTLRALALTPTLVNAARHASQEYAGREPVSLKAALAGQDEAWKSQDPIMQPLAGSILGSPTSEFLRTVRNTFPEEVELFVTDVQGATVAMTRRSPAFLRSNESWWQATYNQGLGRFYIGSVLYDEHDRLWTIHVGAPIMDPSNGAVLGILGGTLDITRVLRFVAQTHFGETGDVVTLDDHGRILASADPALLMQTAPRAFLAALGAGASGWSLAEDLSGNPAVTAYARLEGDAAELGWTLLAEQDVREVRAPLQRSLLQGAGVAALAFVLLAAAAAMMGEALARPVRLMAAAAQRLAQGDAELGETLALHGETLAGQFKPLAGLSKTLAPPDGPRDTPASAVQAAPPDSAPGRPQGAGERFDVRAWPAALRRRLAVMPLNSAALRGWLAVLPGRMRNVGARLRLRLRRGAAPVQVSRAELQRAAQRGDELGQAAQAFIALIDYLRHMTAAARLVAEGDLTVQFQPQGEADLLGAGFVDMLAGLRLLTGQAARSAASLSAASQELAAASTQTGSAAAQVSAIMQQVAGGASSQAASMHHTARALEGMRRAIDEMAAGTTRQANAVVCVEAVSDEIRAVIERVSDSAERVKRDAAQTAGSAQQGAAAVQDTVAGMRAIRERVNHSADKVREMGRRSQEINNVAETIEEIASQTNLLALNAAIEAARAGEHGRGFAVVAQEVRRLADRSTRSTHEIHQLVKDIQAGVNEAVQAMADSAGEVEMGVSRADGSGRALAQILESAESVDRQAAATLAATQLMTGLSVKLANSTAAVSVVVEENMRATEQLALGAGEVTGDTEGIAAVSQENSAAIEEVSASAEEMNAQVVEMAASAQDLAEMAAVLLGVVAQFRLGDDRPDSEVTAESAVTAQSAVTAESALTAPAEADKIYA